MQFRVFEENDYAMVMEWWKARKWGGVAQDGLSSFGLIVHSGPLSIAAGWLYLTNSKFALVEWLVTNPMAPLKERALGLDFLLGQLCKEGSGFGAKYLFTSLKSKGLMRLYEKHGFKKTDLGMTNMVKICPQGLALS